MRPHTMQACLPKAGPGKAAGEIETISEEKPERWDRDRKKGRDRDIEMRTGKWRRNRKTWKVRSEEKQSKSKRHEIQR